MSAINVNTQAISGSMEAELLSGIWFALKSSQSELLLFLAAMVVYFALFMQRRPHVNAKMKAKKGKLCQEEFKQDDYPQDSFTNKSSLAATEAVGVEKALKDAYHGGDYRSVLRCWNTMKSFSKMPRVVLPQVVESMQRYKKDTPFVVKELKTFFSRFQSELDMTMVNDLLESLAKRLDSDMTEKVMSLLPSLGLQKDERTYEILLSMYFTTRNFNDVKDTVVQMRADGVPFTARSSMLVIKTAVKTGDFDEAIAHFRSLKASCEASALSTTPSTAPTHIVALLAELACKDHRLNDLLSELSGFTISDDVVNTMLSECLRQKDSSMTRAVEKLAREQRVSFSDVTYGLLMKGMAEDPVKVQTLFDEVLERKLKITPDFVSSVLSVCSLQSNAQMAERLYKQMKPKDVSVLSTFVRFYAEAELFEKACDIYETDLLPLHSSGESGAAHLDARMERSLLNAALKCGRSSLAQSLLTSSPSDVAKHITMIRNCAKEKKLDSAMDVFRSLEQSGVDLNSVIYNTVLDACVECQDLKAAETWMERMKKDGMTDVVSFNTLIKAYLQKSNFFKARFLMEEMRKQGLQPNRVTFNELINGMVNKGRDGQRREMWDMIEEMIKSGMKPNQVTMSILLKSLNSYSKEEDIHKTMELIRTMDEPMDEVLLSSVVEACVRIGKTDLLEAQLKQLQDSTPIAINGSHTYGSLIKAYGHAKDTAGIWRCWKEMRSRHIKPTSITLGCMIEAIVSTGDNEGAFDLIHQIQEDEQCRSAVNSVIYCSVLKGFTREKKIERAWAVYEEMKERNIELSIITYNTLIDACARCSRMDYLPTILENMKESRAMPNVITYSTMLKGHCQSGNVKAGFAILEEIKRDPKLKPDEIMYNSLLDGCAQNNMVQDGLQLLDEMQKQGVPPSNFTLSILVKLMNRARRLDCAFDLVDDITRKYNFKPNVHVYTNLVQGCVSNQQLSRGLSLLEQMIKERIVPESRTYSILVRSCISKGQYDQAVGLLKGALGLPGALLFLQQRAAVCFNLDNAVVNETLVSLSERGQAENYALPLLAEIRQGVPKVRIDAATTRALMSPAVAREGGHQKQGKGRGKGGSSRR